MLRLDEEINERTKRLVVDEFKFIVRWVFWVPIASALATYLAGLGWIAIGIAAGIGTVLAASILSASIFWNLQPLTKWRDLTAITDLTGFEKINKRSSFMPDQILARQNIASLFVMGNGCSKWTRNNSKDDEANRIEAFAQIRRGDGTVRFLASCPIYLSESEFFQGSKIKKAKKNAASLLKLREYQEKSKHAGGTFEIKTYQHLATLRLIILNNTECIIGHYQEDGDGDSFDTPLLVFHHVNKWGFGGAFKRMFDSEWHRAKELKDDDWQKFKIIKDMPE